VPAAGFVTSLTVTLTALPEVTLLVNGTVISTLFANDDMEIPAASEPFTMS
jgi:hypothetical protein